MKTLVRFVVVGLCLAGVGCASTASQSHALNAMARPATANSHDDGSGSSGRDRSFNALRDDGSSREAGASDRGFDRGVPTPQPARDPSIATPVPQPALPHGPGGMPSARGRW